MTTLFLVIGLVASAFLGLQILFMMFGADMDFDSDMDVDAGDGGGFLSIRSLTAFFGGFGWGGLVGMQAGWGAGVSVAFGAGIGLAFFVIAGFLFIEARKLTTAGNVDFKTSIGAVGSVYITVPASRAGSGKVEVNASGRVSVVDALTDAEEPLSANTRIRVTELIDPTTVLIERA